MKSIHDILERPAIEESIATAPREEPIASDLEQTTSDTETFSRELGFSLSPEHIREERCEVTELARDQTRYELENVYAELLAATALRKTPSERFQERAYKTLIGLGSLITIGSLFYQ